MSSDAAVAPVEGTSFHLEPRQKLEILFAILLALFLFALDQTVVGTALPVIVTDLHGENLYTWAVTIYLLTATISGPIYGKLSDLYGRRPIFIWALGLFLAASIGAGLSNQMWQFILFRGLQGLGGGAVFPIALAVVADLYPPQERAKYGALFGAVFGLSSVLGPGIGGILTDNFGWQSIFFVNVPIVIVSLIICWRLLPPIRNPAAGRNIDYVGAALLAGAIGPFLVGLTNKTPLVDWTDFWVGGLIAIGLVVGAVFLWWEARRAVDPIVNLRLFRNRNVAISVSGMFFVGFGFFAAVIFLPRWFQAVAGATATESGYNLLPLVTALIVSAVLSGQIVARTGRYKWLITVIVQSSVAPRFIGAATASLTFFQQIGGTIGLTLASTFLAAELLREIPLRLVDNKVPQQVIDQFTQASGSGQLDLTGTGDLGQRILAATPPQFQAFIAPLIPAIVQAIHEAFALAIASTFWIGIAAALIAGVLCLFIKEVPLVQAVEEPPAAEAVPAS
jgi:MFS family permease